MVFSISLAEFNDIVTLQNVITAIQRAELVMRIAEEIEGNIAELGNDGRLVRMQLEELLRDVENEELYIIKDYMLYNHIEKLLNTLNMLLKIIVEKHIISWGKLLKRKF